MPFRTVVVPVFQDNYSYLLIDERTNEAAVVDPAEPAKVLAALEREGVTSWKVLTTHKHWDHAGGNEEIRKRFPDVAIYGGANDGIPGVSHPVKEGDELSVGSSVRVRVLDSPCHTLGHVLYHAVDTEPGAGPGVVFTGDTLFLAGCGRFFEGDATMMKRAMDKIAALPPQTLVYCGHEYSVLNLRFAKEVEPHNPHTAAKLKWALEKRAKGEYTIPSTVEEELRYNPYMRTHLPELQQSQGTSDATACLAAIRKRKDAWKDPGSAL